jgi:hypothetical protein
MGRMELRQGQVLVGLLFSEPMRVETVTANGTDTWSVGLVGGVREGPPRFCGHGDTTFNLIIIEVALKKFPRFHPGLPPGGTPKRGSYDFAPIRE